MRQFVPPRPKEATSLPTSNGNCTFPTSHFPSPSVQMSLKNSLAACLPQGRPDESRLSSSRGSFQVKVTDEDGIKRMRTEFLKTDKFCWLQNILLSANPNNTPPVSSCPHWELLRLCVLCRLHLGGQSSLKVRNLTFSVFSFSLRLYEYLSGILGD